MPIALSKQGNAAARSPAAMRASPLADQTLASWGSSWMALSNEPTASP